MFDDSTALVAFRERAVDGTQDVHFSIWENNRWSEARVLVPEGWIPDLTPTAAPALDARDGRAAAAWFTGADHDPRVELSLSSDAGHVWQIPLRLSEGRPEAAVAVALLRDGAVLAVWQEGTQLLLRRVSPQNDRGPVTPVGESRTPFDLPQLTVLADHDNTAPVRVALAYHADGNAMATVLTLPPLTELAKGDSVCACGQATAQLRRGFELHGTIVSLNAVEGKAVAKIEAMPGVMPAKTMAFRAEAANLKSLTAGQKFLGRMEEREAEWWLFDVRLLAEPAVRR